MEKFLIFDNVLSPSYLKKLVDNIFDYNWRFHSNLTHDNSKNDVNLYDFEYGLNAELTESQSMLMLPLILTLCDMSGIEIIDMERIIRIAPRLQMMMSPTNKINDIHVDTNDYDHYVIIFYPHTIDGDTILYNQTTSDINPQKLLNLSIEERKSVTDNFTILERIQPKENRALVFNGNRYHASSSPSMGPRCIININIKCENKSKNILDYN